MSKTPRTNAAWNKHAKDGKAGFDIALDMHREMAELETELAEAIKEISSLRDQRSAISLENAQARLFLKKVIEAEDAWREAVIVYGDEYDNARIRASKLRKQAKEVLGL